MGSKGKVVMYKQAFFLLALVTFARSIPVKVAEEPKAPDGAADAAKPDDTAPGAETPADGADGASKGGFGEAEDKIDEAINVMNKLNDLFESIVNILNGG